MAAKRVMVTPPGGRIYRGAPGPLFGTPTGAREQPTRRISPPDERCEPGSRGFSREAQG